MSKVRFSVFYPSGDDATFDHDYYRDKHVPLCAEVWKPERAEIDKAIDGPYVAAVHMVFESQEAFGAALGAERTGEIMADVANYTNITPITQTSEIVD
jgi:uncharacterized protein (TIGR02118 family)